MTYCQALSRSLKVCSVQDFRREMSGEPPRNIILSRILRQLCVGHSKRSRRENQASKTSILMHLQDDSLPINESNRSMRKLLTLGQQPIQQLAKDNSSRVSQRRRRWEADNSAKKSKLLLRTQKKDDSSRAAESIRQSLRGIHASMVL